MKSDPTKLEELVLDTYTNTVKKTKVKGTRTEPRPLKYWVNQGYDGERIKKHIKPKESASRHILLILFICVRM